MKVPPRTWFIGDTHFDHYEIIPFCNRPYDSVEQMNEALIANWNEVVAPQDVVWHLGDFSFGETDVYLRHLNGTKHLIKGNHDGPETCGDPGWASVTNWSELAVEGWRVVLCHYAMRTWPGASNGALHFYGHSHGTLPGNRQSCDLGVDLWDYRPVSLAAVRRELATLPLRGTRF